MPLIVYALFFVSGSVALIYEVTWVRSLGVVFGGSHLAVSIVLSVFMAGIALGSLLFGRRVDAVARPLRLYGLLEVGVGVFALVFLALLTVYPVAYGPLARLAETNRFWLSAIRVGFAAAAMIVPATLMGGTLPVMSRFATGASGEPARGLAFLYGVNTFGAVIGALATGFLLLRALGVTSTLLAAAAANFAVGLVAVALSSVDRPETLTRGGGVDDRRDQPVIEPTASVGDLPDRLTLWGIGVSGFCALGYEVLWTRMLSLVVGTSVYSFTMMLVAFLAGIGLGSHAHGAALSRRGPARPSPPSIAAFGLTQLAIGVSALAVTALMRDLPTHAGWLQSVFLDPRADEFAARQAASFAIAFGYMFVPAFFMGMAFPMAGALHAARTGARRGAAVGEVLTANTTGAILGAVVSGFVLNYAFGVERSLQMLAVVNVGIGAMAILATRKRSAGVRWAAASAAVVLVALGVFPDWGRVWNRNYFAIFRNNQRAAFDSPERIRDALENTDVLYFAEGASEIISVIRPRGAPQAFLVNGRPEASTSPMDVQCQRTLGHLPMLLHPDPRKVFVLGAGTGMTVGATSIHPEVESIVLAEIEPAVLGATRAFEAYNHRVLDNPKLRVVFDDGRNYLATTRDTFDVITADPIHPWSGGAAYLYTAESFQSVARHLRPGGIACQWLPLYEMAPRDLRTVVRTFGTSFRYVMIWLTHYDAQLVGSNEPIVLDEDALGRRIAVPAIQRDLELVDMGSAEDFLSYYVAGASGARAFAAGGGINTDDNLALEFSAPTSMGVASVMGDNVQALAAVRESVVRDLIPARAGPARDGQLARWERHAAAAHLYDRAHALFLWGESGGEPFAVVRERLLATDPSYAPFRFLERENRSRVAATPRRLAHGDFPVATDSGRPRVLQISAVTMRIGESRAVVMFVDNDKREIYGQRYFDGDAAELDGRMERFAADTLRDLHTAYDALAATGPGGGPVVPPEKVAAARLRDRVAASVAGPAKP